MKKSKKTLTAFLLIVSACSFVFASCVKQDSAEARNDSGAAQIGIDWSEAWGDESNEWE